jgi:DNA-directed RNA polymerase subunit beta
MYEAIIKGDAPSQPGVPESFKVLVKELQALGLNVELLKLGQNADGEPEKVSKDDAKETARK